MDAPLSDEQISKKNELQAVLSCSSDTAISLLAASEWNVENAANIYFSSLDDPTTSGSGRINLNSPSVQTPQPAAATVNRSVVNLADSDDSKTQPSLSKRRAVTSNLTHDVPNTGSCSDSPAGSTESLLELLCHAVTQKKPKGELEKYIQQGADINGIRLTNGKTPLSYAVHENNYVAVRDLIELKADVNVEMPGKQTVLKMAIENQRYDGTEMMRLLLSKGADHTGVRDEVGSSKLNISMEYWLEQAASYPVTKAKQDKLRIFSLERLLEIYFGVIGERLAAKLLFQKVLGHCVDIKAAKGKPLVLLLPGPPGHGKTFASNSLAQTLAPKDDVKFIACSTLRDDADLFGSRLGGSYSGEYSSDGALVSFLRARQDRRTVVILDEFEKIKDLTSPLGWDQAKKMYQAFLEPWQDGWLTDQGCGARAAGHRIDCSKTIFICMTNLGQKEIVEFSELHADRVYNNMMTDSDLAWIQRELVEKELKPVWEKYLKGISSEMVALYRRFNGIIPFLPFTKHEQVVVADTELRNYLSRYRDPPVVDPAKPVDERRMVGNLIVHSSRKAARLAGKAYQVYEGASSLQKFAQDVHNMLCTRELSSELDGASKSKGLREIWLDIRDGNRLDVAFAPPVDRDDEDIDLDDCIAFDQPGSAVRPPVAAGGGRNGGASGLGGVMVSEEEQALISAQLDKYDF